MFGKAKLPKRRSSVLGWQYEMIYLDGDPVNPEQAIVTLRALERAIVIRAKDQSEETFHSVMIPYSCVSGLSIADEQTGDTVGIGEKRKIKAVYSLVLLSYRDGENEATIRLRMVSDADMYKNSRLCCNLQEYVGIRKKKQ